MQIVRFHPSAALSPFVKELIIIQSDLATDSQTIPDTSMVMSFRYAGRVEQIQGDKRESIPAAVVSGLRRTPRTFHYSKAAANLLVILRESGFSAFTKIPAHEIFGQTIVSENLFYPHEVAEILELLSEARTNLQRIAIMEAFLEDRIANHKTDLVVAHAIRLIKEQRGTGRMKDLTRALNISQDPFEKRFRALVGSTPKQYASVIRLRDVISRYPSFSTLTEASLDAGYFDQSHFIRDFKLFTGQPPKEFFKSGRYW